MYNTRVTYCFEMFPLQSLYSAISIPLSRSVVSMLPVSHIAPTNSKILFSTQQLPRIDSFELCD
jgi:hypothetical protein